MNYIPLLLLPLLVLVTLGVSLTVATTEPDDAPDVDNSTASLTITTYQPWCTALELNRLGITRLTDVRPYYTFGEGLGYDPADLRNGINITAAIWTYDANVTIPAILKQPEVVSIVMYSPVVQNATTSTTSTELNVNHNATWRGDSISRCGNAIDTRTLQNLLDLMGLEGAKPGTGPMGIPPGNRTEPEPTGVRGASDDEPAPLTLDPRPPFTHYDELGTLYYGDLMMVSIYSKGGTANDIWRYLQDNGALVFLVIHDERVDLVAAYVPHSIIWPLSTLDGVVNIIPVNLPHREHYGSTNTEGLSPDVHPNVEQWHGLGYNGTGIRVGIIDGSFNLQTTTGDDLPQTGITGI